MVKTGRPKRYTPEEVAEVWEKYKVKCDNHTVKRTEFSQKLGKFVTEVVDSPVTYTKIGLCCELGIDKSCWYEGYETDPMFADIVHIISTECEQDVRQKFEDRAIPTNLAPLWMSKFGYTVKNEQEIKGNIPVVISGEDGLSE